MNNKYYIFSVAVIGLFAFSVAGQNAQASNKELSTSTTKILTAKFNPRKVVQIEAGEFHFKPWQMDLYTLILHHVLVTLLREV